MHISKSNQKHGAVDLISATKSNESSPFTKLRIAERSSSISSSSQSSIESEKMKYSLDKALSRLEIEPSLHKGSTSAEQRRFLLACERNVKVATNRLNHYLRWNNQHVETKRVNGIKIYPTRDRDYDQWVESCLTAMKMCGEVENIVLPRIVQMPPNDRNSDFMDINGRRCFCVRPALMDLKLAKGSTYTLAIAIYFDRAFERKEFEKVTLCLDVRAGKGWPNNHVLQLIPFMKSSLAILLPLFPERLHKALVYPVPSAFLSVWNMISKCMDPDTVDKVCILEGKCKIGAPQPEKLRGYFGEEEFEQLEASRIGSFKN